MEYSYTVDEIIKAGCMTADDIIRQLKDDIPDISVREREEAADIMADIIETIITNLGVPNDIAIDRLTENMEIGLAMDGASV